MYRNEDLHSYPTYIGYTVMQTMKCSSEQFYMHAYQAECLECLVCVVITTCVQGYEQGTYFHFNTLKSQFCTGLGVLSAAHLGAFNSVID